jgi:hypothetical protein
VGSSRATRRPSPSGPNRLHVFARGVGGWLLHWTWDETAGGMTGPVRRVDWRVAYDPVAVRVGNGIHVVARSVSDDLRRWRTPDGLDWDGPRLVVDFQVTSRPAVLVRSEVPDILWRTSDDALGHYGMVYHRRSNTYREGWETLKKPLVSDPVAVSWAPFRMDILGADQNGTGIHWGFSGDHATWDPVAHIWRSGIWYGPEFTVESPYQPGGVAVSTRRDRADIFVRSGTGELHRWNWNPSRSGGPALIWAGPDVVGEGIGSGPGAIVRGGKAEAYAWNRDGTALLQFTRSGRGWARQEFPVRVAGAVPTGPLDRVRPKVDYLLCRAADLVAAGVGWTGYDLVDGDPPTLRRTSAGARLVLVLPPQHIGEETWKGEGPPVPTLLPSDTHAIDTWRAALSGPSQLVVRPPGDTVELTTEGVLRAVHGAPILPFDPVVEEVGDQPQTSIELPWQLVMSPGPAVGRHHAEPVGPDGDTAGLWRTRVGSPAGAPLDLITLRSGGPDPFPLPLDAASRALIRAQPTPARLDRLELSALGGTLSARGSWPGLEWDHDATIGRDQKVRIQVRGMVYPFGHRAVYTRITERFGAAADPGPVAVLRTRELLTITEPVRDVTDRDAAAARVFPFGRVEIAVRRIDDLDTPDWVRHQRKPLAPPTLTAKLARLRAELEGLPQLEGPWIDRVPPFEDLVHALDDFLADGGKLETVDGEKIAHWQSVASDGMRLVEGILRTEEAIEALKEARTQPVPWYFFPTRAEATIRFPVRLEGADGPVELTMPLLFVADEALPETDTMTAFDPLADPGRLEGAWKEAAAGVVPVPGTAIDLVRAPARKPGDVLVVNRLQITGALTAGRRFRPRLGRPGGGPDDWAFDVALPPPAPCCPASRPPTRPLA